MKSGKLALNDRNSSSAVSAVFYKFTVGTTVPRCEDRIVTREQNFE